jgi:hypothetical protein
MSVIPLAYWGFTLLEYLLGLCRRAYLFADTILWSA